MADPRFRNRILPLTIDGSSAAQINPDLADLQAMDGCLTQNLGETIGDFIVDRERHLRSNTFVAIPK